jgi:acetolactate synthase I/II/III large subunit
MPKLYEALAEAFLVEGVDTQFVLLGDGNMHWSTAFAKLPGVHTVHVRHEHSTVAAATAYNVATGKVAVASVTCGPGVTQVMTALPAAVRARLPMVVRWGVADQRQVLQPVHRPGAPGDSDWGALHRRA